MIKKFGKCVFSGTLSRSLLGVGVRSNKAPIIALNRFPGSRTFSTKKPNPADFLTMGRAADETVADKEQSEGEAEEELKRQERLKKKADEKYEEKLGRNFRVGTLISVLGSVGLVAYYGRPGEGEETEDENVVFGYCKRTWGRVSKWFETTSEPIYGPKLLPDPLPPPYNRPATLVVELNETLIHLEWDKSVGWRIAVRPGAKEFLSYLGRYYEVVIFANTPSTQAHPVLETFDPYNFAMYRLYRESTRFLKGKFVKDLSTLNRDLSKVVCVDMDKDAFSLQPENGLYIKPWKGEKDDVYLKNMMTLLEEMSLFMQLAGLNDIRQLLRIVNTNNPEDPFQGWQMHKDNLRKEFKARQQASQPKSGLASLFRSSGTSAKQNQDIFDYIEKIGKEERALHEKQLSQELANMKKMREEAEKKMIEEVKNQKLKLVDTIMGPKPGDA